LTQIDIASIVSSLPNEVRLTNLANTRLNNGLSGGERIRVSIGLGLLHDHTVLLLDEPTLGLDSSSTYKVMQILKSTCVSYNRTIVLSIHQPKYHLKISQNMKIKKIVF
jgi:ABC-type multidrug transport system ATPase subunit